MTATDAAGVVAESLFVIDLVNLLVALLLLLLTGLALRGGLGVAISCC